jgi:hypothetical protein
MVTGSFNDIGGSPDDECRMAGRFFIEWLIAKYMEVRDDDALEDTIPEFAWSD